MLACVRTAFALLAALAIAQAAPGHGTPAGVAVVDGRLTLTGNAPATAGGFSQQLFAETIAGSALQPVSQDRLFTDFPGVDISGLAVGSGLWIEPLVLDPSPGSGVAPRGVWWWSPISGGVEPLAPDFRIDLISARGFGFTTLNAEGPAAEPLELMEPLAVDLNNHRHPLYYVVQNGSSAPAGAYGLFARLTSPTYEPSAPFLIGLNHGLGPDQFVEAVQAINESAQQVPGDYDYDGTVTLDDYLAWKGGYGEEGLDLAADGNQNGVVDAADYSVWRDALAGPAAPLTGATPAPEPSAWLTTTAVLLSLRARARTGRHASRA